VKEVFLYKRSWVAL